ncbi:MAG TPA: MarR family transcriptional regulator [Propionicimonas sp.]|nr:MarR family transcriptional regulator [Propionicimonas sp.]HQA77135.1 MarR family transcriptional regulator [Propionicimonas sp.]HQD96340.1 MarR family transcriptional regulator [Propionicimonas sp.]
MDSFPDALAEELLRVARRLRRDTQQRVAPLGLNPHQARALRVIGQAAPLRPSAVAEELHIAARSATDSIAGLATSGLVDRRPDPADGRAHLLVLTPAGEAVLAEVTTIRSEVAAEVFGRLTEAEQASLASLLQQLAADRAKPVANSSP